MQIGSATSRQEPAVVFAKGVCTASLDAHAMNSGDRNSQASCPPPPPAASDNPRHRDIESVDLNGELREGKVA